MQSQIITSLLDTVDAKIFQLVLQLIVVGAVILYIKDLNSRIMNFYKLKMSDFGRGTSIKIDGFEGYINHVGFNEVEIQIDNSHIMLIPVNRFITSTKIISMKRVKSTRKSK